MNTKPSFNSLGTTRKILSFILLSVFIFIFWMFQTYSPSEKVYNADRQYSFYLEKYNYNKIYETIPIISAFHSYKDTEYKVFLYDEIEQKLILSRYLGETYWNDYYGFDNEEGEFYFDKWTSIKLPRPIDPKAILKQNEARERKYHQNMSDDRKRKIEIEFYNSPFISEEDISFIKPVIQKWLTYYDIDLSRAHLTQKDTGNFNCPPDRTRFYYTEFTPEHDSSNKLEMSYAPNKQLYIDLGFRYKTINGKHYEDRDLYDDSQSVYLIDRKQKHINLLFYYGMSGCVNATFWKDNNIFITCGYEYDILNNYIICLYNISNNTTKRFEVKMTEEQLKSIRSSYRSVYLKERGIIPFN